MLAAGIWPHAIGAKEAPAIAISIGEPEGFAELTEAHVLLVDVYFGGMRKGEARVMAAPGTVRFLEPGAVIDLLPNLTDHAAVEAALSSHQLAANAQFACSRTTDPARCGRLSPEVAGIIFDRDRFRVDIFVNPRFLAVNDAAGEIYLPEPDEGWAMIQSIGAVLSGRLGTGSRYYNLQDRLIVGNGERRLRADLSYASQLGLEAERLVFEWDRPELRYSAGALWAPGNAITGRRKLIGAGIESQIDTRLDKDELLGSPVVVYLDQRARIDVLRDGRVLSSAIYEAGNRQIDTSSLPEGSYDIVLRIEEAGRPAREERRFYTKSRRIPSEGRTAFLAFGGLLIEGNHAGSLEPSGHPFFQGAVSRRIGESLALDGGVQVTDRGASAELGATFLTPHATIRTAAVADLDGAVGGIVQLSSSGTSRLNFNLDLRRIEASGTSEDLAPAAGPPLPSALPEAGFASPDLAPREGSYSQLGGIVSYSLADFRLLGTFFYRDDEAQAARYSVGPSVEWDVLRKGPLTLTLRGDVAATERGESGFAGISLRLLGGRSSFTALGGARSSGIAGDTLGDGPVAALAGAWTADAAGGELALGAGFEHQPRQDDVVLSSEFRHGLGSLAADFVRSEAGSRASSQYSLGFQTTLVAGAGTLKVAGKTTTESMIVARVEGAHEDDRFELLVNEQVAGTISGAEAFTLALPAYRAYNVRVRPTGQDLLAYDSSPRTIGLYPGAVARLEWSAAPVTIKFGRLVSPDGGPIAGASITGKGIWSETDGQGYFQIEAPDDAELTVTLRDGRSFATTLPRGEPAAGIARLGSVVCCTDGGVRLGALDLAHLPGK